MVVTALGYAICVIRSVLPEQEFAATIACIIVSEGAVVPSRKQTGSPTTGKNILACLLFVAASDFGEFGTCD